MFDTENTNDGGEATVDVFIIEAETSPVRFNVNGRTAVIQVGVDSTIPEYFLPSLDNATLKYRLSGAVPEARGQIDPVPVVVEGIDQTDHSDGADKTSDADTFDAEALIGLTIEDFKASVEKTPLTAEQIQKVRDAEADREKPRAGIFAILVEATAAQN